MKKLPQKLDGLKQPIIGTSLGFPVARMVKTPSANAGDIRDTDSIPGWEDPLEEGGHGNPLKYSSLENPMDRGAWWAKVHNVANCQT